MLIATARSWVRPKTGSFLASELRIPFTVVGGFNLDDIKGLSVFGRPMKRGGITLHFFGKHKAVLINYPNN